MLYCLRRCAYRVLRMIGREGTQDRGSSAVRLSTTGMAKEKERENRYSRAYVHNFATLDPEQVQEGSGSLDHEGGQGARERRGRDQRFCRGELPAERKRVWATMMSCMWDPLF